MELTPEQEALSAEMTNLQRGVVLGVMAGLTQRQAYYAAGGGAKNDASADAVVSELLSNPKVREFHDSLNKSAMSEAIMSRKEALERLSMMGRTRITDIVEFQVVEVMTKGADGDDVLKEQTIWRMKESEELQELAASAIKSVTFTKKGPKLELHDAKGAIEALAKMQGWEAAKKLDLSSSDGTMSPASKGMSEFYKSADVSVKPPAP